MLLTQALILCAIAFSAVKADRFRSKWMEIPLDHFNLFSNETWRMRYLVNNVFFEPGNPIFIEVGGEWTITGKMLVTGQLKKLAKEHKGLLIETEHRYYGKSVPPFEEINEQTLKYLQIELALEDLAYFIDKFKNSSPKYKNSKVVLHGCSYAGMLVTWMRLKYPHLVDMAYASSAPLGVRLDYPEYFEIVNDVYANVSVSCIDTIREGFNETAELMKTNKGRRIVRDALRDADVGDVDGMSSYEILRTMMNTLNVQLDPLQFEDVSCLILSVDTDDTDSFHRLANLIKLKTKDKKLRLEKVYFDDIVDDVESSKRNSLAWMYQTCTEQGSFQTLNRENSRQPFQLDINIEESIERCVKIFSETVTEHVLRTGIERVTRRYGGKKPVVTKVVTVQGTKDPWRDLAALEDYTSEAPVLLAEGSHCVDILDNVYDTPNILEVRAKAREWITKWLKEGS